jgi:hypothetical protein
MNPALASPALANTALVPISNAKTILLTTYKRDGTPVATPVSVAFDGGRAFFRSRALGRRHRILQAILVPVAHRMMGYRTLHYELVPG